MAALDFRLRNQIDNSALLLQESDQTAATMTTGWVVAKNSAGNSSELSPGTERASNSFSADSSTPKPDSTFIPLNCFRTQNPYTGVFDNGSWVLTLKWRSVTTAHSGTLRARMRVFKSTDITGITGLTELTGSTQVGSTSGTGSTSADVTSTVTWTPGTTITVTNEYLFFLIAIEVVTASGSNSADADLRTGSASSAGTHFVTPNFSLVYIESATVGSVTTVSSSEIGPGFHDTATVASTSLAGSTNPAPSLTLADDFNSYSHGAPPSTVWAQGYGDSSALIADGSGQWGTDGSGGYLGSYHVPTGDVRDFEVEWEFGGNPGAATANAQVIFQFRAYARGSVAPPDTSQQGYSIILIKRAGIAPGGNDAWTVALNYDLPTGGANTIIPEVQLPQDTHLNGPGAGDKMQVRAIGPHIEVFYQSTIAAGGTGKWIRVLEAYDATLLQGYIGFEMNNVTGADVKIDNFKVNVITPSVTGNPFTGAIDDDFTSYSTGPLPSGTWPVAFGDANPLQADGTNDSMGPTGTGSCASYYVPAGSVGNENTYFTVQSPVGHASGFADYIAFYWRAIAHSGGGVPTSNPDCYALFLQGDGASSWTIQVGKLVNGALTNFLSPTKITLRAGDIFGIRTGGHRHEIWANQKDGSGNYQGWRMIYWFSDGSFASGYDVFEMRDNSGVNPRVTNYSTESIVYVTRIDELLPEAEFDADISDWNPNGASISRDTGTVFNSGPGSLKVISNNAASNEGTYTTNTANGTITPGTSYRMGAWVNAPAGAVLKVGVEWHNSIDSFIDTAQQYFVGNGGWQWIYRDAIAPSTSDHALLYVYTGDLQQAVTYYVGAATLLPSPTLDVYTAGTGAGNTDAATVSSKTSISAVETAQYVESAIVSSKTTPSGSDIAADVDAATISSKTIPSATDVAAYVDSATTASKTTPSSADIAADVEAGTCSSKTTVTATDIAAYIDAATLSSKTSVSATEIHEIPDSATVSSITTVTIQDTAQYVDGTTVTGKTTSTISDAHEVPDSATISSVTTLSAVEVANYVDSAIITTTTTVSSTELHEIPDSGTITGTTTITTLDTAQYNDVVSVNSVSTPSITDVYAAVDAQTIRGVTTPNISDVAAYVDGTTVSGTTSASINEVTSGASLDSATIATVTTISIVEIYAAVDAATVSGKTMPSISETHEIPDSGTVTGKTTVTSADIAAFVDAATIPSTTLPSIVEFANYVDTASAPSKTSVSISDVANYLDVASPTSNTSSTITDMAAYVEGISLFSTTTPSITEQQNGNINDAATCSSITVVALTDVAAYVEDLSVSGISTVSIAEIGPANADAATAASTTIPSIVELTTYAPEAATIASSTQLSSTETTDYIDSATAATVTVPSITENVPNTENATCSSTTTPSISDIVAFIESRTISTVTSISYVDISPKFYVDAATISTKTTIASTDVPSDTETATAQGTTTIFSTDVAAYIDASTPRTTTTSTIDEGQQQNNTEAATITSITYVTLVEYIPILVDIEYQAYRRYEHSGSKKYGVHGTWRRWLSRASKT